MYQGDRELLLATVSKLGACHPKEQVTQWLDTRNFADIKLRAIPGRLLCKPTNSGRNVPAKEKSH
jgi:hypothetical protein